MLFHAVVLIKANDFYKTKTLAELILITDADHSTFSIYTTPGSGLS